MKISILDNILTINDFLRQEKFFSKDIKQKINSKQFLINGIPLTQDDLKKEIVGLDDAGDFIFKNIKTFEKIKFLAFEEMFECNIPYVRNLLKNFKLLKLSKKKYFVIILK